MLELAVLALVVVALMAAATWVADSVGRWLCRIEIALMAVAAAIAVFVMLLVSAEVIMRYGFSAPIPGHLEGSELLMPIIVFLGLPYMSAWISSSIPCRCAPGAAPPWAPC